MRWGTAAGLVALCSLLPGVAAAQPSDADKIEAARLAREAEQHGNRNELREALRKFKSAAILDPTTPAYLCNIGLAYYGLSDFARAHLNLSRCYQATGKWPAGVQDVFNFVEDELARRDFAPILITGVPEDAVISIKEYEGEGELRAPLKVYLAPGNYIYEASLPGYKPWLGEIRVLDRTPLKDQYRLVAADQEPNPGGTTGGGADVDRTTLGTVDNRPTVSGSTRRSNDKAVWGWTAVGAGAVLGLGGGLAYLSAVGKFNELEDLNREGALWNGDVLTAEGERTVDAMQSRERIAYVMWGVGAAAAGVGVYLLLQDDDGADERPLVSAAPTDGGGMVWLNWTK